MINQIYEWDFMLLEMIQKLRTPVLDRIMSFITHLGSAGAIWILIAIIFIIGRKTRISGIKIAVGLALGLAIGTLGMKHLFMRERPFTFEDALITLENLLISAPSDRYSFPSGHTLSSFTSAWLVLMYNKKIGTAAVILAALISFSRMYLYVHYPTDVICGAILGTVFGLCAIKLYNFLEKKITGKI